MAAVSAVIAAAAIPPFLTGVIAPRIAEDFTFRAMNVGVAIAGYYVVSGLCSAVAGHVVACLGAPRALRLASMTTAGELLDIALCPAGSACGRRPDPPGAAEFSGCGV